MWVQDFKFPFYIPLRVGKNGKLFKMIKLRSMGVNADRNGVDSTSNNDSRITPIGHFIRKFKLDELSQLINVLKGDMSLVGPRPNVKNETDLYTEEEKKILLVSPGITDFASIVFADEGTILEKSSDPNLDYNQLIRPYKSRLALFYIEKKSFFLDLKIIFLTMLVIISRRFSLNKLSLLLKDLGANSKMVELSTRENELKPTPPPGSQNIVVSR